MAAEAEALDLQFIDIGFNITDHQFQGIYNGRQQHEADLDAVLKRAQRAGVGKFLCTGSCVESSQLCIEKCRALNKKAGKLVAFATVGIHPCSAQTFKGGETIAQLRALVLENLDVVRAFGEIGLDAQRQNWCPLDQQIITFREQLKLAVELGLPLFLHNRDTAKEFLQIATEIGRDEVGCLKGVVHSFDGTWEEAEAFLDFGFDIGINGCGLRTEANLEMLRDRKLPIDRLHFETDAPWCSIKPTHPSKKLVIWFADLISAVKPAKHDASIVEETVRARCEPMHIRQVAEVLYRTLTPEPHTMEGFSIFCKQVLRNSSKLFKLDIQK